jgi:hypothetical protein
MEYAMTSWSGETGGGCDMRLSLASDDYPRDEKSKYNIEYKF